MTNDLLLLITSAAGLGLVHTVLGPDHYVPFVAMARARRWSRTRTLWITAVCGVGHVLGSVVLGALGIAAGITLRKLEMFESSRGELAGWALIAFGLVYLVWSITRVARGHGHHHVHAHADGVVHEHAHDHHGDHAHPHADGSGRRQLIPWSLFVIFVLGPCEPLIPLLMFPAATHGGAAVALVALAFALATIGTMLAMVLLLTWGLQLTWPQRLDRFGHVAAGALTLLCGVAIKLGL